MNCSLVSVLVTLFNREKFVGETLHSIVSSSFDDLEVVVVDDCSSDSSLSVVLAVSAIDSRIQVHSNVSNLGDYGNRNRAASLATGKYLKYLDADDLIYRHSLATMVDAMERFPDAALALSRNVIDPDEPYPRVYSPEEFFHEHYFGKSPIGVGPSAAIIRRDCFEAVGGFSGRQFVGDTELWMKLAERWPIVTLPPALVWWRRHPGQQMQLELTKPEVIGVRAKLELEAVRRTTHLTDHEKHLVIARIKQHFSRRLLSISMKAGRPLKAWQMYSESELTFVDLIRGFMKYQ